MREIKFRARRLDNGKWIYGFPVKSVTSTGGVWHIHTLPKDPDSYYEKISIDEETLGQFTGEYDYNGKEIYEGDSIGHPLNIVEFSFGCWNVNGDRELRDFCKFRNIVERDGQNV